MNNSIINQTWPSESLEHINQCPFCGSKKAKLAYQQVKDWSFNTAPGDWDYYDCEGCGALYLNPRPTQQSIGNAYGDYYTHQSQTNPTQVNKLKNEFISIRYKIDLNPRMNFSGLLKKSLSFLSGLVTIPFDWHIIATLPKGKLLDVGCGGGDTLFFAKQVGWQVSGLELDLKAVEFARSRGLDVELGGFEKLQTLPGSYDCIVCAHVLEHVYDPDLLLRLMTEKLKSGGMLVLSLPNAQSDVRYQYGKFWRGLEAPRHIAIPSLTFIKDKLIDLGYTDVVQYDVFGLTEPESKKIKKNREHISFLDVLIYRIKKHLKLNTSDRNSDFIQLVARKV